MSDPMITGDPSAVAPTPEAIGKDPSLMSRHSDFGAETACCDIGDRDFHFGERVKIARPTHVIDKERNQEGMSHIPVKDREPLELSVTGESGEVQNGSYWSEDKQTNMIPLELDKGGLVYVDEKKLERHRNEARAGMGQSARVVTSIGSKLTAEERRLGIDFTRYQAASRRASAEGLAFPKFTDWLTIQETKKE